MSGQRGNAHGPPVAATAFKKIAVLPVHGGMLYARKQQPVAVETAVLRVVLKQALGDLLIVRVVTKAAGGQRQLLHRLVVLPGQPQVRISFIWTRAAGRNGSDAIVRGAETLARVTIDVTFSMRFDVRGSTRQRIGTGEYMVQLTDLA